MKKKTAVTKSKTQSANKLMQKEKIFEWSLGGNLAEVLLAKSFSLDCKNSGIFFLKNRYPAIVISLITVMVILGGCSALIQKCPPGLYGIRGRAIEVIQGLFFGGLSCCLIR